MYESFRCAAVPQRERLDYFQSVVDRVFCPMHVDSRAPSGKLFHASVSTAHLGAIRLASVAGSACTVRRTESHVGRTSLPPYLVKCQLAGEAIWSQHRRVAHLRPGDFVIASMAEPYCLEFSGEYHMPVMAIGAATMQTLTGDPDRFLGVRLSREDADCGIFTGFIAQVTARLNRLEPPLMRSIEATLLDLLGAILGARSAVAGPGRPSRVNQIKAYIKGHLHDRRLAPAGIAAAFAISVRQLHALFAAEPRSVSGYLRTLRVQACRRMLLEDAARPGRSLTDIALACGFYDYSHMSKCFKEEFQVAPGEFRRRQLHPELPARLPRT